MKKNYIYAVSTVCIWGTNAAVIKSLLQDIPNFQAQTISSVFAFVFLLAFNVLNGSVKQMKNYKVSDYFLMAVLGFVGLFLYYSLYYYGITQLTSQEACILNYLWPMMLVIFSCLILKEKVTAKKIIAMVLSFAGIIVLTIGSAETMGGNRLLGIASCIVAAVCYGLFSVLNKKRNMNQNITMMIIWQTTAGCSWIAGQLFEDWVLIQGMQWLGILWLGVVINAVAYLMWALALKDVGDSAMIANIAYLTPIFSIIISAVFLKETIQASAIVALVLIVGGILLQSVNNKKQK